MNFSIPVYEATYKNGDIVWRSFVCDKEFAQRGRHASKIRTEFVKSIQRELADSKPGALRASQTTDNLKVRKVRLSFRLENGESVSGEYPLIIARRKTTYFNSVDIAYHPMRPHEWFVFAHGDDLSEAANQFFKHAWRYQNSTVIEQMVAPVRQKLRLVSINVTPPTLLAELRDDEPKRAKLGPQKRASGNLVVLPEIAIDMTARASEDDIPHTRRRTPYSSLIEQRFLGSGRRAVVLLGPTSVGKRSLVHRFVYDLLAHDDFENHRDLNDCRHVWSLSGRRLIAGMSYMGQWEQRCGQIIEDLERKPGVLHVTDIHAWGRIGQTISSERALADFFRGPVARNECAILATSTRRHSPTSSR